uniref:Lymphotactin-like n=1 Tax=Pogona vitticeps TaxID=103695 RepID=A0A6J0SW25_9SAUR
MKLFAAVILAMVLLQNFDVFMVRGALGSRTMPSSYCESLRTKEIKCQRIKSYSMLQNEPKNKVLLILKKKNTKVCVPAELSWVKKIILCLDKKNGTYKS